MKKDTFFNISTERTKVDTTQPTSKSKRKIFKAFGFSSLAVMMAVAGTFAFAPLGAGAQGGALASASEISNDINTRADGENIKYAPSPLGLDPENDPVIYTTESGLEIKFGGVSPSGKYTSGTFNGYPYFTMGTYSNKAVNWIIVGTATNVELLLNKSVEHLFSTWKANYNASGLTDVSGYGTYFFGNTYETTTPAGSAINSVTASKGKIIDKIKYNKPKANSEIQSGCVLAISECLLGTSRFNATGTYQNSHSSFGSYTYGNRYRYRTVYNSSYYGSSKYTWGTTNGDLFTAVTNLYNSGLALTSEQKSQIQPQTLKTCYDTESNWNYPAIDTISGQYLFPLAWNRTVNNVTENFSIQTYLSSDALRIAYNIGTTTANTYWMRTGCGDGHFALTVSPTGAINDAWAENTYGVTGNYGVRPAMVITYS